MTLRGIRFRVAIVLGLLWAPAAGSLANTRLIEGDAKLLVVQPIELPERFALAGGDYQPGGGYVAMYFRPEVLAATELPRGALLGVLVGVEVHTDSATAAKAFAASQGPEAIRSAAGPAGSAGPRGAGEHLRAVEERATDLAVADEALLFRVEYELQGLTVVDYRYRIRVANAIANLVVSARAGTGGGDYAEPPGFAQQAEQIAQRQANRLAGARP